MLLKQNGKYQAALTLTGFDQIASNVMVANELTKVGFADVIVSGRGKDRTAVGRWGKPNITMPVLPKQVTEIKELC